MTPQDQPRVDALEAVVQADEARAAAERVYFEALEAAQKAGVTQGQLARRLGISQQSAGSRLKTMKRRLAEIRAKDARSGE